MADAIGVDRKHFQGDHYDVCLKMRSRAIARGAREVTTRELLRVARPRRPKDD